MKNKCLTIQRIKKARLHTVQNHRTEASDNLEILHPMYPEALFIKSQKEERERTENFCSSL